MAQQPAQRPVLNLASGSAPRLVTWAPVASPQRLRFNGTTAPAVVAALTEVFGAFPLRLSSEHAAVLRGMAAAAGEGATPYRELLAALERHGGLEVATGGEG